MKLYLAQDGNGKNVLRLYLFASWGLLIFCLSEITILKDKIDTNVIPPLLMISGTISFIYGVRLARAFSFSKKLREKLNRLLNRKIIQVVEGNYHRVINKGELENFLKNFETEGKYFGHRFGLLLAIIMLIVFLYVGYLVFEKKADIVGFFGTISAGIIVALLEIIGGYVAGHYLGRMMFNGILVRKLGQKKIIFKLEPGHIDKSNGIKPLIDFYYFQGIVAAIPALFIGIWWFLMLSYKFSEQSKYFWLTPYLILLTVAILIELIILIRPFWLLYRKMQKEMKKKIT